MKTFKVDLSWTERHRETFHVEAESADEAENKALDLADAGDDFDIYSCDETEPTDWPNPNQLRLEDSPIETQRVSDE